MPQEPPPHQAPIKSKRDPTALCEVEDSETGAVLRTTFTFVETAHTVWFGQIPNTREFDITTKDIRRSSLRRIPDETIYPPITPGVTIVPDDSDVAKYYIKRSKLLCLDNKDGTRTLP